MKKKEPIKLKENSFRVPKIKRKDVPIEPYQWDVSTPNSQNNKEKKIINNIKKDLPGLYLSDVIRYLSNKNPDKYITLIVSSCREFHSDLPKDVIKRQKKTASVSVNEYLKKYVDYDIK